MREQVHQPTGRLRFISVWFGFVILSGILMVRAFDLHVLNKDFLQSEGDQRSLRSLPVIAHRGMIMDRYGAPLAVSTPVDSVWAQPRQFDANKTQLAALARILDTTPQHLKSLIHSRAEKEFVYLKRHGTPEMAKKVMALEIAGVSLLREYRRYYPDGEVFSHVLGLTNVDDKGQEGLELGFDFSLRGSNGSQLVMKDRLGRIIQYVDLQKPPSPGKDLVVSLDRRLQYLAYRELKRAVFTNKAKSGSVVILDVQTGEVLAMVNQPSLNPNNREEYESYRSRNRAVTDNFEPGSTVKPFTIAAALESRRYNPDSIVDTSPGIIHVGHHTIKDIHDYGKLNLLGVIQKSSNVAASKIALSIPPAALFTMHQRIGFGEQTNSGFPGEVYGEIVQSRYARDIERATLSYGYGLSVTTLQLARAYAVLAADGKRKPVSFLLQSSVVEGEQVIDQKIVRQVRSMLESVITDGGTGTKASVPGYWVSGKTGTVKKLGPGGYTDDKYLSIFAGMAPARNPRLVMVIAIHEPKGKAYYGGEVAAPVFASVMSGALRLMGVPPDVIPETKTHLAAVEGRP